MCHIFKVLHSCSSNPSSSVASWSLDISFFCLISMVFHLFAKPVFGLIPGPVVLKKNSLYVLRRTVPE